MSSPTLTEERTKRVMEVMRRLSSGEWIQGETVYQLADDWGCHVNTVRGCYGEALRHLRRDLGEEVHVERNRVIMETERMYTAAMSRKGYASAKGPDGVEWKEYANPDVKGASAALRLRALILGMMAKPADYETAQEEDALGKLSPEEMAQQHERAARELRKLNGNGRANGKVH